MNDEVICHKTCACFLDLAVNFSSRATRTFRFHFLSASFIARMRSELRTAGCTIKSMFFASKVQVSLQE